MYASPSDPQVWHLIGTAFMHEGNLALARDAFQRAIQSSTRADSFLSLAKLHIKEGDTKSAIFVLRKASEVCPDDKEVSIILGSLLVSSGMVSKGSEKLMQLQHLSSMTQGNLALSLSVGACIQDQRNEVEGALLRYRLANAFESPCLWNNIALCFSSKKKKVAAISCLERAVYLNPLDWRITYNLALILLHLGQFASCFHYLKSSASMSSGAPHVVSLLAYCLQLLNDDSNANQAHLSACKAALTVSYPNPLINYAIFLYKQDPDRNKDHILDLVMEFEKMWVKRRQANGDFDMDVMRLATRLASIMHVAHHMAWIRTDSSLEVRATANTPALATTALIEASQEDSSQETSRANPDETASTITG